MIQAFNTLTDRKELLDKEPDGLKMFVCGPTVYDLSHIGHARTYIAFDIIVRWLRYRGYKLKYLQNITDIDDKIIVRAIQSQQDPRKLAKHFEKEYYKDMRTIGVKSVDKYARATDHIKQIVTQVQILLDKGYAYLIEKDGYYFDLSKFADYGKLSRRTTVQAEDGVSRIDESIKKRNKGDFCLWKFSKPGEPSWQTKLGAGRPGWHIEDTAITEKYFGPQYDIHGGAADLKFPHHEAEIAQQESASGLKPFVRLWMHTGFLVTRGEKMSKSKGNFITIRDFVSQYSPAVLRFMIAGTHYRSPLDYSDEKVKQAASGLKKITDFMAKLKIVSSGAGSEAEPSGNLPQLIKKFFLDFANAMDDDFNTAAAIGHLFSLISETEKSIKNSISKSEAKEVLATIEEMLKVFGIDAKPAPVPVAVRRLVLKREKARKEKNWQGSDVLRAEIEAAGFSVEDTKFGPVVVKI